MDTKELFFKEAIKELYCLVARAAEGISEEDLREMDKMGISINRELLSKSRAIRLLNE